MSKGPGRAGAGVDAGLDEDRVLRSREAAGAMLSSQALQPLEHEEEASQGEHPFAAGPRPQASQRSKKQRHR